LQSSTNPHSVATRPLCRRPRQDDLRASAASQPHHHLLPLTTKQRLFRKSTPTHPSDTRRQGQVFNKKEVGSLFRKEQTAEYHTNHPSSSRSTLPDPTTLPYPPLSPQPPLPDPQSTTPRQAIRFASLPQLPRRQEELPGPPTNSPLLPSSPSIDTSSPRNLCGFRIQPRTQEGTAQRPLLTVGKPRPLRQKKKEHNP